MPIGEGRSSREISSPIGHESEQRRVAEIVACRFAHAELSSSIFGPGRSKIFYTKKDEEKNETSYVARWIFTFNGEFAAFVWMHLTFKKTTPGHDQLQIGTLARTGTYTNPDYD